MDLVSTAIWLHVCRLTNTLPILHKPILEFPSNGSSALAKLFCENAVVASRWGNSPLPMSISHARTRISWAARSRDNKQSVQILWIAIVRQSTRTCFSFPKKANGFLLSCQAFKEPYCGSDRCRFLRSVTFNRGSKPSLLPSLTTNSVDEIRTSLNFRMTAPIR